MRPLVLSLLAVGGLTAARPAGQAPDAPPKPVPAVLPAVVARVNGQNVTKDDLEKMARNAEANAGMSIPPERRDRVLRQLLDELVTHTLLEQEARTRGLAATETDIDAMVAGVRQRFATQQEFDDTLKERGMTLAGFRLDAARDISANKVIEAELSALPGPTDDEAKEFYTKNPDRFTEQETIRASHILIRLTPDADAAARAKAKATIDSLLEKAKAGQDFGALAKAFSEDSGTAPQGGDLNYFRRGMMVAAFNDAAFALQPGQISDVVATQYGYHLIKVTDRKPGRTMPFEEAAPRIKQFLGQQTKQQRHQAVIDALKKKAAIEILI